MALAELAMRAVRFDPREAIESIPRAYNFAADILQRNLAAGRANKPVYIDPRGSWTYGQLAERVDRFGGVLRSLGPDAGEPPAFGQKIETVEKTGSCLLLT
jgi:hypothetical protein